MTQSMRLAKALAKAVSDADSMTSLRQVAVYSPFARGSSLGDQATAQMLDTQSFVGKSG